MVWQPRRARVGNRPGPRTDMDSGGSRWPLIPPRDSFGSHGGQAEVSMAALANPGGTGPPEATARHGSGAGAAGAGFAPLAGTPGAFGGAGDSRMAAGAGCNASGLLWWPAATR